MNDTTSLADLPSEPSLGSGIGSSGSEQNVVMQTSEKPTIYNPKMESAPTAPQGSMSSNSIDEQKAMNEVVSGIQQASASGATGLPSRDIPTNASSGWYANLTYKGYGKSLGNEQMAQMLNLDYRNYFRLSEKKDNVLAVWFMGTFLASGKLPYMNLSSIGWDQKGTSGRGYKQGRYRGENFFYTELEYRLRFGIDKKHPDRYGMDLFTNLSAASSSLDEIKLFDRVAPGYGTGFRIMLKKLTRSNITLDYARGIQGQSGFYINYNEFF